MTEATSDTDESEGPDAEFEGERAPEADAEAEEGPDAEEPGPDETEGEQPAPKVLDVPEDVAEPLRQTIDQRACRVLDAEALQRLQKLSNAVVRAENRARQIIEEAEREAETIREEARDEGRREGYEELLTQIGEVRERYRQIQDEAEEDTLELAFRVAKRLVGREIERDPSVVREIVDRALERVRGKRQVVVRAHPTDASELEKHTDAFSEKLDGAAVYIEEDEGVERGGCILETDANRVDAQLDVQIERLREVLTEQ